MVRIMNHQVAVRR